MELHLDIMPAFSIMVADFLLLQSSLPFGADFSHRIGKLSAGSSKSSLKSSLMISLSEQSTGSISINSNGIRPPAKKRQNPFRPSLAPKDEDFLNEKGEPVPTPSHCSLGTLSMPKCMNMTEIGLNRQLWQELKPSSFCLADLICPGYKTLFHWKNGEDDHLLFEQYTQSNH